MTRIYTARMGYRGDDTLLVTRLIVREPLGLHFAPSAELLVTYLEKRKHAPAEEQEAWWGEYAVRYVEEMRRSFRRDRWAWDEVMARESVTLLCFCKDARACHRTLLAGIFGKLGAEVMGERGAESEVAA